ncbi:TlpA family protein disulfide reductase [Anaerococcus hydrogenalis]|uniref:TlpA family protein disulfide reductase n=1 Tax=Anaerococcus hydrogenalis TaxID=33029 RepID=UPI001E08B645|nr:TlpA disulfide reductase family protein [Anaerococcus hydrogenalis]MBS5989201.1 TlpA family protein disulfide reductase [Anaerococcus hydrogenalis]
MKNKKLQISALALALAFTFVGCGKKENTENSTSNKTSVESKVNDKENAKDNLSSDKSSTDSNDQSVDDLMQKQNDILQKHDKQWQVAFSKADKSKIAGEPDVSYDAYLLDLVEKSKDELSKEDYDLLKKDVEEIGKIEKIINKKKGIDEQFNKDKKKQSASTKELKLFPEFKSKDFDGNEVTKEIFKDKKLTLVNFWFNGCAPCVGEIPHLQKLNDEIEKMGGQVIGINTEAKVGDEEIIKEAKKILKKQGATYKNISLDPDSELGKYAEQIMSYPTSVLVDSDGNIVGDPIVGAIDKKDTYNKVKTMIEKIIKDEI